MASKRRLRRSQCGDKQRLEKDQAIALATKLRQRHGMSFDGYPCLSCGGWHVGRRPKKIQQAITKRREASNA